METTFNNVTITVVAADPAEAYTRLCNALGAIDCEWTTDTYTTHDATDGFISTKGLFPTA